ncbi:hypothetical protein EU805_15760 [Salipiger sp. IMCC34102]|uniref:hypothetical protein n=1 Tax=Salipiger sp. IMCC34102 TaxID=2510647 RepID=UPI00101BAE04|nr:hypothetical protein [Salipiger sp. IMCC34102]RYH01053.1 hypothetical protein EU805_15760 [Salipiger sp. IMCC34102]
MVVVIGSGRSGTSLCAKILGRLGIDMEDTLNRANEMNPEGYFEDAKLVEINKSLISKLLPVPRMGPRETYPASLISAEVEELKQHFSDRISDDDRVWGFKDPRVSQFLPIYRQVFQSLGIVPVYVFCARSADAVVESIRQAGNGKRDVSEQIYFIRSFLALRDCAANAHVVHYEKLLSDPVGEIDALWQHVGEPGKPCPLSEADRADLVDERLNRSQLRAVPVTNPMALRIEALLDTMNGTDFDRDMVMSELREIDGIHSVYQSCLDRFIEIGKSEQKDQDHTAELQKNKDRVKELQKDHAAELQKNEGRVEELKKDLVQQEERHKAATAVLTVELSHLQAENAQLNEERNSAISRIRSGEGPLSVDKDQAAHIVRRLRMKLVKARAARDKAVERSKASQAKAKNIANSTSFRAGQILADSIRRPGLRTLAMPLRLARLRRNQGSK